MSFRKQYRVTPDEEDAICRSIEKMLRGLFEVKAKEYAETLTEKFMNDSVAPDDSLSVHYSQSVDANTMIALLGQIRADWKTNKKNKVYTIGKRSSEGRKK